jgi:hypothetical protein
LPPRRRWVTTALPTGDNDGVRVPRTLRGFLALAVVAAGAGYAVDRVVSSATLAPASCTVGTGANALVALAPEQAADAATIAAVAKRDGLPNHAVTIALAAGFQESKLLNLPYGDRDSLGIFQQRPSQGWGPPADLLKPAYAAQAFFDHLVRIEGWQNLTVAEAAQQVQHSADGTAYAQWESSARALARALTGEVPGGLTCSFRQRVVPLAAALTSAAQTELGPGWSTAGRTAAQDWIVAEWLVAHSYQYGVVAVAARGQRWTAASGRWVADPRAASPSYLLSPARNSA